MKAMQLQTFGEGFTFRQTEIDTPEPTPGEVLVRVAGSSFNPIDNKIATLGDALGFAPTLPAVPGMDVSGVVVDVGSGISRFQPGDRVFGCAGGLGNMPGALAEYMVVDERLIAPAPQSMNLVDAACIPLVAITAWTALFVKARLREDQVLLVHGGAGGVGHMAVQLGVHAGAEVYATVSSETKAQVVEALGGMPVNYHDVSLESYVDATTDGDGFDVVFDTVGGGVLDQSFRAAAREGQVVSTATRSSHDLTPLHSKSLSLHVVFMLLPMISGLGRRAHGRILKAVAELVDAGKLAVLLDEARFDYTEIGEAHRYWSGGNALGKISIVVDEAAGDVKSL